MLYLYEAEHPLMEGSGRVVFGQNCLHQNSFDELLGRHQDVKAMTAVLHTGLQNLRTGEAIHNMKTTVILSVLYAQAEKHSRGNRTGGTSETLKTAGHKKNEDGRCTQSTHVLTVRASIISLKFLFPTILFLIALTESLGLGKKASHPFYC